MPRFVAACLVLSSFTGLLSPRPLVAQAVQIGTVVDSVTADGILRLGDIPVERLSTTARRVARLRATPAELRIKLGDTLNLREVLRVLVLDSTGRSLGSLPVMDTRVVNPGAVRLDGVSRVAGVSEGEAMLRIGFPQRLWTARSDSAPHVDVRVRVTRDGPSSPIISPLLRSATGATFGMSMGGGSGNCQLDHRRIECSYVDASEGMDRDRRQWLRAVVLARSDTGARRPQSPTMQDQQAMIGLIEAQMTARMAAQRLGRIPLGGSGDPRDPDLGYEVSQGMDTIFIADQAFPLPRRDSALVILVDRHDRQRAPTVVGTVMIRAALPSDFWTKTWSNGDTTFIVSPKRDNTYLRDALTAVPAIRAFLP